MTPPKIVERLRAWVRPAGTNLDLPLYGEAADEIERLQAALDHDAMMHRDEIEQSRADVKRWRLAYEDARAIASAALRALEQARKE